MAMSMVSERKNVAMTIVKRAMRLPFAHQLRLAGRLVTDGRVPWTVRLPLVALFGYLAMPLDIIPDFIPVIGHLDDLLVAGIAVWWFVRTSPPSIAIEHLHALEHQPLGRFERTLPWIVWGACIAAVVIAGVVLCRRP